MRNIQAPQLVLILGICTLVGFFVGYTIKSDAPKNCAELGAAYMVIGKRELEIADYESERWNLLIEDQTRLTNECYSSLK